MIWQENQDKQLPNGEAKFGVVVTEDGDLNSDKNVDGLDFFLYQTFSTDRSAWYIGVENESAPLTVGLAPYVTDVIVSGSLSLHTPFSLDTVDGDGGQLATVPVGGADTISIVFSENVNVMADSLAVFGLRQGTVPTVAEFSYDANTFTGTWRFEGWTIQGDNYLLDLKDAVTDVDGNLLDGEWINPASITTTNPLVSEFPSGDGTPGGNFRFVMTLLPGDANLDGQFTQIDYDTLWANFGQTAGQTFIDADFDGDGDVDNADFDLFVANSSTTSYQDVWVLADLDGDFDVDNNDINKIGDNLGMASPTYADGDINGDGVIDQLDLDLASAQFGIQIHLVA